MQQEQENLIPYSLSSFLHSHRYIHCYLVLSGMKKLKSKHEIDTLAISTLILHIEELFLDIYKSICFFKLRETCCKRMSYA